jgi:outer membrane lipoprotein carrier protein
MRRTLLPIFLALLMVPSATAGQGPSLGSLIDGVGRKLERMRDLSAHFVQISEDALNRIQRQEGHLYLRRPRMMRWEYQSPEEYLFVSDGRTVYFYVPADMQVSREDVGDSMDDRIPIMFLLGRSDLENEFTRIVQLTVAPQVPGMRVLEMHPRRKNGVEEVQLEVDPGTFDIRRLRLTFIDGSTMDLMLDQLETDADLDESIFDFEVPPGVDVIEGIGP